MTLQDLIDQIRDGKPQMSPEDRHRVAIHESGHAVVSATLGPGLVGVSLHEGGGLTEVRLAGGMTIKDLEDQIIISLAGREAERAVLGDVGIGSGMEDSSDLGRAPFLGLLLETSLGVGSFGNVLINTVGLNDLSKHPWLIGPVQTRLDAAQRRAATIVANRTDAILGIAKRLEETGYVSPEEVHSIMKRAADPVEPQPEVAAE